MMNNKRMSIIIALILVFSGAFITLDLIQVFEIQTISKDFSPILKGPIILLTTILVFFIKVYGISRWDTRLLKITFIMVIIADISLVVFNKPYVGIIIFSLVQLLLIYRNGYCIHKRYSVGEILDRTTMLFILALISLLFVYLISIYSYITDIYLYILFIYYGTIKSFSLLVAILSFRYKVFPKINGLLLLIGVVCFYLCDLNVGLTIVLNKGFIKNLSNVLIWIFYTPALTLIALSGYDFRNP